MEDSGPLPWTIPARIVLAQARPVLRAVEANGLEKVLLGCVRIVGLARGGAWLASAALVVAASRFVVGPGSDASWPLGLGGLLAMALVPGLVVVLQVAGLPALRNLTGTATPLGLHAAAAQASLASAGVSHPRCRQACQCLWMIQVAHLLCDPKGQALMAHRALGAALQAPSVSPAARSRM